MSHSTQTAALYNISSYKLDPAKNYSNTNSVIYIIWNGNGTTGLTKWYGARG
jgi:hypothetical protein